MTKENTPQPLTSKELEEAIRRHHEQAEKLLAEVRACRDGKSSLSQDPAPEKPTL